MLYFYRNIVELKPALKINSCINISLFPCYQISDELRQILTSVPKVRTNEGLKKVSRIMFFEKFFYFCSDLESAQHVSQLMLYFLSGLSQIQRLCRSTRAFMIFPLEREADLSRLVGYERYVKICRLLSE